VISVDVHRSDQSEEPDPEKKPDTWLEMRSEESFLRIDTVFCVKPEVEEGEYIVSDTVQTDISEHEYRDDYQSDNTQDIEKIEKFIRSLKGFGWEKNSHQGRHADGHSEVADGNTEYMGDERIGGIVTVKKERYVAE
jgi:hypothetical protein